MNLTGLLSVPVTSSRVINCHLTYLRKRTGTDLNCALQALADGSVLVFFRGNATIDRRQIMAWWPIQSTGQWDAPKAGEICHSSLSANYEYVFSFHFKITLCHLSYFSEFNFERQQYCQWKVNPNIEFRIMDRKITGVGDEDFADNSNQRARKHFSLCNAFTREP